MEIENKLASDLSVLAGDESMRLGGRTEWSREDALAARTVYDKLKLVQKMDETPTEEPNVQS